MNLSEKIVADLTEAMKSKDATKLSTLRMVKANLMNRKIEKGSDLTEEEVTKALQGLVKQRRDSIEQYQNGGRAELAAREAEEIDFAVSAAISQTGATSIKDMGTVMKAAIANLAGRPADGKLVSDAVRAKLS